MTTALAELETPRDISEETHDVVAWADGLSITCQDEYSEAVQRLQTIKKLANRALAFFKPMKQKADEVKREILDREKEVINPLNRAEEIAKRKLVAYTQEQERKRQEEQRRLQAEADERARREKERLEKEAAKLKTPEKQAEKLEAAAAVVAPVIHVEPAVEKVAGVSVRKIWKYRVTDINAVPRQFMSVNDKALAAFATSTKGEVLIAGVEFYAEDSMAIGGR